jgi:uncharacterized metal-binding protein YceD (DUF177 family)
VKNERTEKHNKCRAETHEFILAADDTMAVLDLSVSTLLPVPCARCLDALLVLPVVNDSLIPREDSRNCAIRLC